MLVKLYQIDEVNIRLFGTSGSHAKAEDEPQVRKFHDFIHVNKLQ